MKTKQEVFDKLLELSELVAEEDRSIGRLVFIATGAFGHEIEDLSTFTDNYLFASLSAMIDYYKMRK